MRDSEVRDQVLAPVLRDCVLSGDFSAVARLLSDDATLDTSNESGRRHVAGRDAIIAHLAAAGPGDVLDWDAQEWPSGASITFEWRGAKNADRRRWYLRQEGGQVTSWHSYAAQPKLGPTTALDLGAALEEHLGPGARWESLSHGGNSGAALVSVVEADGTQLIAKRISHSADWLGRITRDRGRTALLWEAGVFATMPRAIDHGIEAVLSDADGWWVLMRDISATFLGPERRLSRAESQRILGVAAEMHATFLGEDLPGAAALADRLGMSSLFVAEAERGGSDLVPKQLEAAWDAFADVIPEDVVDEVLKAVQDPQALAGALEAAGPLTLLHGDLRDDNLGLAEDRVALIDWDLATLGTPTVEFAWYLCHDAWRIDATHDELERDFRDAEGERLKTDELELGLLSGLVQYGWIFGHSLRVHPDPAESSWAREELDWWVPRTRQALEHSGGMPR